MPIFPPFPIKVCQQTSVDIARSWTILNYNKRTLFDFSFWFHLHTFIENGSS